MDNTNINLAENAFRESARQTNDAAFIAFLDKLTQEEKAAYFYIEARRSDQMVIDLSEANGSKISISELKNQDNWKKLPLGFNSEQAITSLIKFWDMFGESEKPGPDIRKSIIEKYESTIRPMAEAEKSFFLDC